MLVLIGIFALAMIALRFTRPELVFFHLDDGLLFNLVDDYFRDGTWPVRGLEGTKGIHYGPVPLSSYLLIRNVLSDGLDLLSTSFWFNVSFQALTLAYFVSGLARHLSRRTFLLVFGLILTSPQLLYYSRAIWDNPYLIGFANMFSGIMLHTFANAKSSRFGPQRAALKIWICLGCLAGLSLGTHLMAVPLVATMVVFGLSVSQGQKARALGVFVFTSCAGVILAPYILDLVSTTVPSAQLAGNGTKVEKVLTGLRDILFQWSGWISWPEFARKFIGPGYFQILRSKISFGSWLIPILEATRLIQLFWGLAIIGLPIIWLVKGDFFSKNIKGIDTRRMVLLTSLCVLMHLVMALSKDATTQPHYLQSVWWIPFVLVGLTLDALPQRLYRLTKTVNDLLVLVIISNGLMNFAFAGAVAKYRGFDGVHLGPAALGQRIVMEEICTKYPAGAQIPFIEANSAISGPNIQWWMHHVPSCKSRIYIASEKGGISFDFSSARDPALAWREVVKLAPSSNEGLPLNHPLSKD
ncbi:MAG: hypothetical protein NTV34_01220 [Proteobacteria bacterium]|nr:hypothetical protein [Pseudomonadota bacterium]